MIFIGILFFFGFWNLLLPRGAISRVLGGVVVGMGLRLLLPLIPDLAPATGRKVTLVFLGMFTLYFVLVLAWILRSRFLGKSEGLDEYLGLKG